MKKQYQDQIPNPKWENWYCSGDALIGVAMIWSSEKLSSEIKAFEVATPLSSDKNEIYYILEAMIQSSDGSEQRWFGVAKGI